MKNIQQNINTQVTEAHSGVYTCTPYNTHGTMGTSEKMRVEVTSVPACVQDGSPALQVAWQVSSSSPPHKASLTISDLPGDDLGVSKCEVSLTYNASAMSVLWQVQQGVAILTAIQSITRIASSGDRWAVEVEVKTDGDDCHSCKYILR